jgi:beta-glucanase (GH16 family)
MSKRLLRSLHQTLIPRSGKSRKSRGERVGRRSLSIEPLEARQMLSITTLANLSTSQDTGEKPQSKMFEYAGQWWTVMPNSSGTWVFRLDGTSWTPTQQITTNKSVHADVKLVGDLAHVLLFNGNSTQLATLQYDDGPDNRFEPWSLRPQLVSVPLNSSVETATIDVDSTGRMWVAYDVSSTVEVRYSDGLYTTWSAPITVASGINSDDISGIIAMPGNKIGVFWSNQSTDRFGFRIHQDGAAANIWSADELPASQSALNVGGGMADDHLHLAVTSDGTLYAAVKTSYDKSGYPKIGLLVRRPNGTWDNFYAVDTSGTRPVIAISEAAGKLIIAYTSSEGGGTIYYRESPLGTINLAPRKTLITSSVNNVTTTKYTSTDKIAFMADEKSVLFSFDTIAPNLPPTVNAGLDNSTVLGTPINLNGSASDDGKPSPATLTTAWSKFSGPATGSVTFGNANQASTTVSFSEAGTYVLRLTATDGELTRTDDVTITVTAPSIPNPNPNNPPPPSNSTAPKEIAFQDGVFPSVTYAGTTDTKIAARRATTNYGTATTFDIDGDPDVAGLFRWDVSAIPTGSTVTSVAIELNVTGSTNQNFEVFALNRAWSELAATWQRYTTNSNWAGAGATGSGDQSNTVLGALGPASKGIYRVNLNADGIAAVQNWINDADQNFGIIVKDFAASDGVDVSSSEASNKAQRPKLIINYSDPPAPASATAPSTTPSLLPIKDGITWDLNEQFSDEFNDAALDELKWDTVYRNWTGRDPGIFDSSNVSVGDGYLKLDVNIPAAGTLPAGKTYTTASVNTTGGDAGSSPREILYGFFEIRAQSMDTKTTSAFWMFKNTPEEWTEIDAVELVNTKPRSVPTNAHNIRENGVMVSQQEPEIISFDEANIPDGQTHDNSFHTYGIDWNPETIDWYIDGVKVRSLENEHWHQPLQLNLTNSIMDFNGVPTAAELAAAHPFLVDYIRVYDAIPATNAAILANFAPLVDVGPGLTTPRNVPLAINGTYNDDGRPTGALLNLRWNKISGPGAVTFGDDEAAGTTATFSAAGSYVLRLTVNDGLLYGFDELAVTVT